MGTRLSETCLRHVDPEVFRILHGGRLTTEKAREITRDLVLDDELYLYSEVLAKLGMRDGFSGFREDLIPRLKGLYLHNHVRRMLNRQQYREFFTILLAEGVDFLCGRWLSSEYRYCANGFRSIPRFDVIVHGKDLERARKLLPSGTRIKVSVAGNDCACLWETAKTVSADGCRVKTLSPTAILLLYSRDILREIGFRRSSSDRIRTVRQMHWLHEYKAMDADAEKIDFSVLRSSPGSGSQPAIRRILDYAYAFYGEKEKQLQLSAALPQGESDPHFLRKNQEKGCL